MERTEISINQWWYIHTKKYCSAIKDRQLVHIQLDECQKLRPDTRGSYCMISFVRTSRIGKTNV